MEGSSEGRFLLRSHYVKIPAWMDLPEETVRSDEEVSEDEELSEDAEEEEEERSEDREEWVTGWEGFKEDIYETRMRRKMSIAWMLAKEEFSSSRFQLNEIHEISHSKEKRKEMREAFWELSAERWKPCDMERLSEISSMICMKKAMELERVHVMKQQLEQAQEKDMKLAQEKDMKPRMIDERYLDFRDMWVKLHSFWGGVFEDITTVRPMGYSNESVPQYVHNYGPPDTLQIFSIKLEGNLGGKDVLSWPLHVFGLIALRDSIDQLRNVIFNRKRDDCQIITKDDPYLVLTGPTRAVVMNDETIPVTIEADLKVKSTDGSLDKHLIFEAGALPSEFPSCTFHLIGRNIELKIALARVMASVEATIFIRVLNGTWPIGFSGQLAASIQCISHKKIVLAEFGDNGPITDNGYVELSRSVVSVEPLGGLVVSYKAWRGDETMKGDVLFGARKKGSSCATLTFGSCILEVLVAWSPIRPVCEELVSMSEMALVK